MSQGLHGRLYDTAETSDIRSALEAINPDVHHDDWVHVGMGLKAQLGEQGRSLFEDWSGRSEQYDPREVAQKWRSFRSTGAGGYTIRTLFRLAMDHGWERPPGVQVIPRTVSKNQKVREDRQRQKDNAQVAEKASVWWGRGKTTGSHPYLELKGVQLHGARIMNESILLIPMRIGSRLWSIQSIYPNGQKSFMKGGRVSGCYFSIGTPEGRLWICEGFATGASIHESTGDAVAVALSGSNMKNVARHLSETRPHDELLVAGDSDSAGQKYAIAAMKAGYCTRMVYPDFNAGDTGTDWNDFATLYGKNKTSEELLK